MRPERDKKKSETKFLGPWMDCKANKNRDKVLKSVDPLFAFGKKNDNELSETKVQEHRVKTTRRTEFSDLSKTGAI